MVGRTEPCRHERFARGRFQAWSREAKCFSNARLNAVAMMPGPFVLAELPAAGTVAGEFSARHPGLRLDVIRLRRETWGGAATDTVTRVEGASPSQVTELVAAERERYGNATLLPGPEVLVKVHVKVDDVKSESVRHLARLLSDSVIWWIHASGGTSQLRAEVPDAVAAEELVGRLDAFFRKVRIPTTVRVGALPTSELPTWRRLRHVCDQPL
jgi:hypothetical protein